MQPMDMIINHKRENGLPLSSKGGLVVLCLGVLFILTLGCARNAYPQRAGAYPVDIFAEMHYSQSQRSQEPDRLYPPKNSVSVAGAEIRYAPDQYPALETPEDLVLDLNQGKTLFSVNCVMCHGPQGRGDGAVGNFLESNGYTRPPDLTGPMTVQRTDGEIFGIVTNGIFVMPKFSNLLSQEDRWQIIHHLRSLQGQ
jgi:mono/diheme cytochrome c family protein